MRDAVLGALVAALIGVIGFLFLTKEDNNVGAYNPYNVAGAPVPGQAVPGQPAPGQAPAPAAPEPIKTIVIKQTIAPGQPKKPSKPDAPTAPDPRILQTQNVAELMNLINMLGNPSGPDQERGCYIVVRQVQGGNYVELAKVNEKCTRTMYADGSFIVRRTNGDPLFNFFGGPISLIRVDVSYPDINMMQPRASGFSLGFGFARGPGADCFSADDGVDIQVLVCTPNP